jgi:capsular polysaccharide biosynthesis protein
LSDGCHLGHPFSSYWRTFLEFYHVPVYESVICFSHSFTDAYGHWVPEVLPVLSMIPSNILKTSVFAVPEINSFMLSHLDLFGVHESQILASRTRRFFAFNYYTGYGNRRSCGRVFGGEVQMVRTFLRQRFAIPDLVPTRHVLFSRRVARRRIANMDEFLVVCRRKWPVIIWEVIKDGFPIAETVIFFNQVKFFFAVHGAALANIMFMQQNTTAVEIATKDEVMTNFIYLSYACRLHYFVARDSGIVRSSIEPQTMNVSLVCELFQIALDAQRGCVMQ